MPARLLAYGGTSFSERRRIGQWPAIPEATLRDTYGLQPQSWCYGVGVLEGQPFLILRERQNVESRGGYPFSLLLDPGEAVWRRFAWNGAALIAALLAADADVLFRVPESCSGEALERALDLPEALPEPRSSPLGLLLAASVTSAEPIAVPPAAAGFGERPHPAVAAAALAALPVWLRDGYGWLVGGGTAHGRALGARLVLDDLAPADSGAHPGMGQRLLTAAGVHLPETLASQPMWTWQPSAADVLDALLLLTEMEAAQSASDELVARVEQARELREPVVQAMTALLFRATAPLGARATAMVVGMALRAETKLEPRTVALLHQPTVIAELRKSGSPPKRVPRSLPLGREVRLAMWLDYLERLGGDVRKSLADALDQLGPQISAEERRQLTTAALNALPASEERLGEWARFKDDAETWPMLEGALREEALRRFRRGTKSAADAYIAFGGEAADVAPPKPAPARAAPAKLVPQPQKTIGARTEKVAEEAPDPKLVGELRAALGALLFETDAEEVAAEAARFDSRYATENSPALRAELDGVVFGRVEKDCRHFAKTFSGKYQALGDVMAYLSEVSQESLIRCLEEKAGTQFPKVVSRELGHALNNSASRNAYTAALGRYLLKDRALCRQVAGRLVEDLPKMERKLKTMLAEKDPRR